MVDDALAGFKNGGRENHSHAHFGRIGSAGGADGNSAEVPGHRVGGAVIDAAAGGGDEDGARRQAVDDDRIEQIKTAHIGAGIAQPQAVGRRLIERTAGGPVLDRGHPEAGRAGHRRRRAYSGCAIVSGESGGIFRDCSIQGGAERKTGFDQDGSRRTGRQWRLEEELGGSCRGCIDGGGDEIIALQGDITCRRGELNRQNVSDDRVEGVFSRTGDGILNPVGNCSAGSDRAFICQLGDFEVYHSMRHCRQEKDGQNKHPLHRGTGPKYLPASIMPNSFTLVIHHQ